MSIELLAKRRFYQSHSGLYHWDSIFEKARESWRRDAEEAVDKQAQEAYTTYTMYMAAHPPSDLGWSAPPWDELTDTYKGAWREVAITILLGEDE